MMQKMEQMELQLRNVDVETELLRKELQEIKEKEWDKKYVLRLEKSALPEVHDYKSESNAGAA